MNQYSRAFGVSLAFVTLAGCSETHSRPAPRAGYYGPYGNTGYQQGYQPQQANAVPELNRPVALGSAFTAFGPLFDKIPALTFPLPPLPGSSGGGTSGPSGGVFPFPLPTTGQLPFPFPFPQPSPNPSPSPTPQPSNDWPAAWAAWEDEVLARTNETRARGVVCGGQSMPPAGPVGPNAQLRQAARLHSKDMGDRNYFEHTNPEGAGPGARAQSAGFRSTFVGENIAAGQPSPASVVKAWIDSPGHCVNMMDPRYKVLGVGYFFDNNNDRFGHYWTQDFGG